MEGARSATDPRAVGAADAPALTGADMPAPPSPLSEASVPSETAMAAHGPPSALSEEAIQPAATLPDAHGQVAMPPSDLNAGGPLLYYAVWLPGPAGHPSGPPLYLPAGGMPVPQGGVPPAPVAGFAGQLAGASVGGSGAAGGPMPNEAQAHNQRLLVWAIILGVMAVHLPWIAYLVAVHGCWGTFIDACWQATAAEGMLEGEVDPFAETLGDPFLFARIVFLMLRVQAVLSADWGEYSQAMQLSTGLGSFVLTRIVAANGLVMQGRGKAIYLAAICLTLFVILFWAELHLTSDQGHPLLGDDTVLDYISQTLPPDFASYGSVRDGLMQLLQFLRLADALILGACLALPTSQRKTA